MSYRGNLGRSDVLPSTPGLTNGSGYRSPTNAQMSQSRPAPQHPILDRYAFPGGPGNSTTSTQSITSPNKPLGSDTVPLLAAENDRLKAQLAERNAEVETWQRKYITLEKSYQSDIETLKFQAESAKRSTANETANELSMRYTKERGAVEAECAALRQKLTEAEAKTNLILRENDRLVGALRDLGLQLETWKTRAEDPTRRSELENKLALAVTENERLTQMLQDAQQEKEAWRARFLDADGKLKKQLPALEQRVSMMATEIERLNADIQERDRQLALSANQAEAYEQLIVENRRLESALKSATAQNDDLEGRVIQLTQEIERLRRQRDDLTPLRQLESELRGRINELETRLQVTLKEKAALDASAQGLAEDNRRLDRQNEDLRGELQTLRDKLVGCERAYAKHLAELNDQLAQLRDRLANAETQRDQSVAERWPLETQIQRLTKSVSEVQAKLSQANADIERLQAQLKEKDRELENWRSRCSGLEARLSDLSHSETRSGQLQIELKRLSDKLSETEREADGWKKRALAAEGDGKALKARIMDLENEVIGLSTENERLNHLLRETREDADQLRSKAAQAEAKRAEAIRQADAADADNQQLRIRLAELQRALDGVRGDLERLNNQLRAQSRENDELRTRLGQFGDLEGQVSMLSVELTRVAAILRDKDAELESLRARLAAENAKPKFDAIKEELTQKITELNRELDAARNRIADLERRNKELYSKCREQEIALEQRESDVIQLRQQLAELAPLVEEHERVLRQLQEKQQEVATLKEASKKSQVSVILLGTELERLHDVLDHLARNSERLAQQRDEEAERKLREMRELYERRIQELQSSSMLESQRLREQGNDVARLQNKIRELEVALNRTQAELDRAEQEKVAAARIRAELEAKLANLGQENTRLGRWAQELREEAEAWRQRAEELERMQNETVRAKIEELENHIAMLSSENQRLRQLLAEKDRERARLEEDLGNLQRQIRELQDRLAMNSTEIERLNRLVEGERTRCLKLERTLEEARMNFELEKKNEIERAIAEVLARLGNRGQNDTEVARLRSTIRDLEGKLAVITTEKDRLDLLLNERSKEADLLKSSITNLDRTRVSQLEDLRSQVEASIRDKIESETRGSIARLTGEKLAMEGLITALQARNGETELRLILLSAEIDRLRGR
eukprot:TRINITY_DN3065_c0_g1_i4.p1 TRINITY_DN3065_c0_g1~~TRINITY_DN3065_c0_g1_i4.p1  ORF type:complete len:1166 (-),score=419.48 TRINITY_DN3065_c0_g1_i4:1080-4577(-)